MVKVKSQSTIEKNYRDAAGTAGVRYAASIDSVSWQAEAKDGQDLYVQQMQNAEVLARRESGINKVSDTEFKNAMRTKGAPIIAGRMSAAAGKMASAYAPFASALGSLSLPKRVADPMQNIDNRLKPVVQLMVDTKKAQG